MELKVVRDICTDLSTSGKLFMSGLFFCFTLEPRSDKSQGKPYCVPEGRYKIALEMSPHFGFVTPHLLDTPGFDLVEIHPGNYPQDTHACLLVGKVRGPNLVSVSVEAFKALMQYLTATKEDIWITYEFLPLVTDSELGQ